MTEFVTVGAEYETATYAAIQGGIVLNVVAVAVDADGNDVYGFCNGEYAKSFDYFIRVDLLDPEPGMSWLYDGTAFSPPVVVEE